MVVEMELIRPLIGGCKRAVKTFTGSKLAYSRRKHGLPWWLSSKESACNAGNPGSIPGSGRSRRVGNGKPILAFLLGEFHGQRSLAGYSSLGHKETDTTKQLTLMDIFSFFLI